MEDKRLFGVCRFFCPQLIALALLFSDDVEPNSIAAIPGMGIPEQLKAAMEQEQSSKSDLRERDIVCAAAAGARRCFKSKQGSVCKLVIHFSLSVGSQRFTPRAADEDRVQETAHH